MRPKVVTVRKPSRRSRSRWTSNQRRRPSKLPQISQEGPHRIYFSGDIAFLLTVFCVLPNDEFSDFFHGFALLTALAAQRQVGCFFAKVGFALQDSFGALDDFAGFKFFGEF